MAAAELNSELNMIIVCLIGHRDIGQFKLFFLLYSVAKRYICCCRFRHKSQMLSSTPPNSTVYPLGIKASTPVGLKDGLLKLEVSVFRAQQLWSALVNLSYTITATWCGRKKYEKIHKDSKPIMRYNPLCYCIPNSHISYSQKHCFYFVT